MDHPTFSICIPNYNYAHYIGETIESVLNQSYPHFEIVVADNASTDNSIQVVESYKDPRIRLVKNHYNIGFAPNLQAATAPAKMEFVNLLSSDDKMRPDALENYAEVIRSQGDRAGNTVLFSDAYLIDGESNRIGYETNHLEAFTRIHYRDANFDVNKLSHYGQVIDYQAEEVLRKTLIQLNSFAQFLTIVYPRVLWERLEGYNCIRTIGPDKFFNYKLLAQRPDVKYVRKPLDEYRSHGSPNEQAQKATVKQQIDDYLNTLDFSNDMLEKAGVSRESMIDSFLDRVCLKSGLTQLVYGTYRHAVRCWAFGLATYPGKVLKKSRFYALTGLLLLGPLAKFVAKPLYKIKHKPSQI